MEFLLKRNGENKVGGGRNLNGCVVAGILITMLVTLGPQALPE
jgi:hypothetical protein